MPTLDQYSKLLLINKLRLDDELEIQAEMQNSISLEVSRLNTRAIEAENRLKVVEASLYIQLKEEGGKMTADEIKACVRVHRDRAKAWEQWQTARELHEQWNGLLQAWITKGYKLADIGGLFASDYFAISTITRQDGTRRKDLNAIDEESRSAMRRAYERADERHKDDVQPRRRTAL